MPQAVAAATGAILIAAIATVAAAAAAAAAAAVAAVAAADSHLNFSNMDTATGSRMQLTFSMPLASMMDSVHQQGPALPGRNSRCRQEPAEELPPGLLAVKNSCRTVLS